MSTSQQGIPLRNFSWIPTELLLSSKGTFSRLGEVSRRPPAKVANLDQEFTASGNKRLSMSLRNLCDSSPVTVSPMPVQLPASRTSIPKTGT